MDLRRAAFLSMLLIGACASDEAEPSNPNAESPVVGDWFGCQDQSCDVLYTNGVRYAADGKVYDLRASEDDADLPFNAVDPYCFPNDGTLGTWSYDVETELLTRTSTSGATLESVFTLEGSDRARREDGSFAIRLDNATGHWSNPGGCIVPSS